MLWLSAALVLAVAPGWMAKLNEPHIDDVTLGHRFFENPAEAETTLLNRRVVLAARVESISSVAGAFDVRLAPKTTPAMPVHCSLSRRAAAALGRGRLVLVEGVLKRGRARDLRLDGCRVGYDFRKPAEVAALAYQRCLMASISERCRKRDSKCEAGLADKMATTFKAYFEARTALPKTIRCDNPIVTFIMNCERWAADPPSLPTCDQRSEFIDIRNEIVVGEDGKTPGRSGQ